MKNETEFIALVARMMGETKRMQFKCEGPKAFVVEAELTIDELIKEDHMYLSWKQMRRVIHADTHRYVNTSFPWEAVIEIWGIYSN
jgi:hypothetical protein